MRSRGRRVASRPRAIARLIGGVAAVVTRRAWTRDTVGALVACVTVLAAVVAVVWHAQASAPSTAALAPQSQSSVLGGPAVVATAGPSSTAPTVRAAKVAARAHQRRTARLRRQALARAAERRAKRASLPQTSTMRVASLNVLGSNHVGRGLARAAGESQLLASLGVDIVGLQEVQRDQRRVFLRQMSTYTMWPQDAVGRQGYRLQILFRTSRFEMVDGGSVNAPFVGMSVPMPYVLLRDRADGVEFWVVDAHLSPEGLQGQRNVGTQIQESLIDRLNDSHPVVMVGDMNEHTSWFCRLAANVPVFSANGGSSSGGCAPAGPIRIDWIVGSDFGDQTVAFSGYTQDDVTKRRRLSDHFLVYATAAVTAPPTDPTTP